MKSSSAAQSGLARALGIMAIASLVSGLLSSVAASAQPTESAPALTATTQLSAEETAKRKAWRAIMSRTPKPKTGCFKGTFPSTEWQEAPCTTPPNQPYLPRSLTVGSGTDSSAQASGRIFSATGSFDGVVAQSETGTIYGPNCTNQVSGVPNIFGLQINTNPFTDTAPTSQGTSPCSGAAVPEFCQGWLQFVYSSTLSRVFMQYWLLNYRVGRSQRPPCPDGFQRSGRHCWRNSGKAASVPAQDIGSLGQLSLEGDALARGNVPMNSVVLYTASSSYGVTEDDDVLYIDQNQGWQTTEFNVFGDGCLTQANFSDGTTIMLRTEVTDGTTNAPSCSTAGFTGETNNLTLVCPCRTGLNAQGLPTIAFMETNDAGEIQSPTCPAGGL